MKDYYYILGISRNASAEEIKKAYRKLSMKFHPDQNNNDEFWEERFKDINEAYETLNDSHNRKAYDEKLVAATNDNGNRYSQNEQSIYNHSSSNASNISPPTSQASSVKKKRAVSITSVIIFFAFIGRVATCSQDVEKHKENQKLIEKWLSDTTTTALKDSTYTATIIPDTNHSAVSAGDNSAGKVIPPDITDIYEINWTSGVTQYRCALILRQNKTGLMRVKCFANGHTNLIEEKMEFTLTEQGDCYKGSNPVYAISKMTAADYIADNLFVSQDENGNVTCKNVYNGETAVCTVNTSTDYLEKKNFLADFEWKLK